MNNLKFYPIGTVLTLKDKNLENSDQQKRQVIIVGYKATSNDNPKEEFDYVGYYYPAGFFSRNEILAFNEDQIDQIYYYGFKNKEYEELLEFLGGEKNGEA